MINVEETLARIESKLDRLLAALEGPVDFPPIDTGLVPLPPEAEWPFPTDPRARRP